MSVESNGGNTRSRLDRIEAALELMIADHEEFRLEHKRLLTAQVLLTDAQQKLTEEQKKLAEAQQKLAEAQLHTEDRLSALIGVVDDLVRNRPRA